MQNKEDDAFPFVMLLVILLGLSSIELDEVVTSSSTTLVMFSFSLQNSIL